jgi:hypothetical protein
MGAQFSQSRPDCGNSKGIDRARFRSGGATAFPAQIWCAAQQLTAITDTAFTVGKQLARYPEHAALVPHVAEIKRLKNAERRKKPAITSVRLTAHGSLSPVLRVTNNESRVTTPGNAHALSSLR